MDAEYLSERLFRLMIGPQGERNRKRNMTEENACKLASFKDKHNGERCFVVGGAPSLNQLDLGKLDDEYVFTVNRGYKLRDMGLRHSTYHFFADAALVHDDGIIPEVPHDFAQIFFVFSGIDFPVSFTNIVYYDYALRPHKFFQEDISNPLYASCTCMYSTLEAAKFMGFTTIVLLGVDLDFAAMPGHAYFETSGEKTRQRVQSVPTGNIMLSDIRFAMDFLEKAGVRIHNASPYEASLPFMPKIKYDLLFS
jgi:hypothetical protein